MLCNAANGFSSLFPAARQAKETRLGGKRVGFLLRFNKQQPLMMMMMMMIKKKKKKKKKKKWNLFSGIIITKSAR